METYLYHINYREIMRDLTKLRCSNHSLPIEQGRYSKLEVAFCKTRDKDQIHFLTN